MRLPCQDPLSLHRYLYANADGVNNFDPTGQMTLGGLAVRISIGAALGALFTGLSNYSTGKPWYSGIGYGAILGAVLLPLGIAFPLIGLGLALLGVGLQAGSTYSVLTDPTKSTGQQIVAVVLAIAALWGTYRANQVYRDARAVSGSWFPSTLRMQIPLTRNSAFDNAREDLIAGGTIWEPQISRGVNMPEGLQISLGARFDGVRPGRYYLWAVDDLGFPRICPSRTTGGTPQTHSQLMVGQNALAAGELQFRADGSIIMNNSSGGHMPSYQSMIKASPLFKALGYRVEGWNLPRE